MARNLFVLSLLSLSVVGCVGPKKAPSPVTDGDVVAPAATTLTPVTATPAPAPPPAPPAPAQSTTPATSAGRLPISNAGNK